MNKGSSTKRENKSLDSTRRKLNHLLASSQNSLPKLVANSRAIIESNFYPESRTLRKMNHETVSKSCNTVRCVSNELKEWKLLRDKVEDSKLVPLQRSVKKLAKLHGDGSTGLLNPKGHSPNASYDAHKQTMETQPSKKNLNKSLDITKESHQIMNASMNLNDSIALTKRREASFLGRMRDFDQVADESHRVVKEQVLTQAPSAAEDGKDDRLNKMKKLIFKRNYDAKKHLAVSSQQFKAFMKRSKRTDFVRYPEGTLLMNQDFFDYYLVPNKKNLKKIYDSPKVPYKQFPSVKSSKSLDKITERELKKFDEISIMKVLDPLLLTNDSAKYRIQDDIDVGRHPKARRLRLPKMPLNDFRKPIKRQSVIIEEIAKIEPELQERSLQDYGNDRLIDEKTPDSHGNELSNPPEDNLEVPKTTAEEDGKKLKKGYS